MQDHPQEQSRKVFIKRILMKMIHKDQKIEGGRLIYLEDTRAGRCSLAAIYMKLLTRKTSGKKKIYFHDFGWSEKLVKIDEKTMKKMKNKKEVTWHHEDSLSLLD